VDYFFALIWIFFILSALIPLFRQRRIQLERYRLIHRQEALSILGIPFVRYVTVEYIPVPYRQRDGERHGP